MTSGPTGTQTHVKELSRSRRALRGANRVVQTGKGEALEYVWLHLSRSLSLSLYSILFYPSLFYSIPINYSILFHSRSLSLGASTASSLKVIRPFDSDRKGLSFSSLHCCRCCRCCRCCCLHDESARFLPPFEKLRRPDRPAHARARSRGWRLVAGHSPDSGWKWLSSSSARRPGGRHGQLEPEGRPKGRGRGGVGRNRVVF